MRFFPKVLAATALLVALAGCQPTVPDSAAGVGFGDYGSYMRERERTARAERSIVPAPQVTTLAPRPDEAPAQVAGAPMSAIPQLQAPSEAEAIARDAVAAVRPEALQPPTPEPAASGPAPTTQTADSGITDQSDLEALRASAAALGNAQYRETELVQPTAVPTRPSDAANVIEFALRTTNRVGEQLYRRSVLTTQNHQRNCAQFASQDLAQEEFLRRGGPQRDPLNLDPDGDGFACWWDPAPYRAAARAAD